MDVLVLLPLTDRQRSRLEVGSPASASFCYLDRTAATAEDVATADAIVGNVDPALLPHARKLRLLQLNSAGYDDYLAAGTLPAQAVMASAVGAYGQAVSEHMFAMVLALMKRLPAYWCDQRAHVWDDHGPVTTLAGAQVVVLGCGDIGSHFAQLCQGMGAQVTGVRRRAGEVPAGFAEVRTMDELPELLGTADVVASFLPSTAATRGLADAGFFAALKPGAYFANGGRGDLVVQADLAQALASGRLAGAALDVTAPEPLPADDPLWDAPNVFITPHVSGGFHHPAVLDNIVAIAAENLRHLDADEPLRNAVTR